MGQADGAGAAGSRTPLDGRVGGDERVQVKVQILARRLLGHEPFDQLHRHLPLPVQKLSVDSVAQTFAEDDIEDEICPVFLPTNQINNYNNYITTILYTVYVHIILYTYH